MQRSHFYGLPTIWIALDSLLVRFARNHREIMGAEFPYQVCVAHDSGADRGDQTTKKAIFFVLNVAV